MSTARSSSPFPPWCFWNCVPLTIYGLETPFWLDIVGIGEVCVCARALGWLRPPSTWSGAPNGCPHLVVHQPSLLSLPGFKRKKGTEWKGKCGGEAGDRLDISEIDTSPQFLLLHTSSHPFGIQGMGTGGALKVAGWEWAPLSRPHQGGQASPGCVWFVWGKKDTGTRSSYGTSFSTHSGFLIPASLGAEPWFLHYFEIRRLSRLAPTILFATIGNITRLIIVPTQTRKRSQQEYEIQHTKNMTFKLCLLTILLVCDSFKRKFPMFHLFQPVIHGTFFLIPRTSDSILGWGLGSLIYLFHPPTHPCWSSAVKRFGWEGRTK